MSAIEIEQVLLTVPSGTSLGTSPDVVDVREGIFTQCIVNGVDVSTAVINMAAHIAATSGVHGVTGNVVGTTDAQILTNKSLVDASTSIVNNVDNTKKIAFTAGGTTGTTTTFASTQTTNKTITFPDISDTVVTKNTTDVLTNKTLTAPVIGTIVNTGTLTLPTTTDTLVGRATTDVLTNKTINSSSNTIKVSGTAIDSLINQDMRTSAAPSFTDITLTALATDTTSTSILFLNPSNNVIYRPLSEGQFTTTWNPIDGFSGTTAPNILQIIYSNIGNVVTCSFTLLTVGIFTGNNTANITLPIARTSLFSNVNQLVGPATASSLSNGVVGIGNFSPYLGLNNTAILSMYANGTNTDMTISGSFQYLLG